MNLEAEFERLKICSRILIWGGGYHTKEALRFYKSFFRERDIQIVDKNKAGQSIEGYKIIASDEADYSIDYVVIMSSIYHDEIEYALRNRHGYQGTVIGLYAFRRVLLKLDSYEECIGHMEDFVSHMEQGIASYSYDYIFQENYSVYKKIRLYAFWASSIGESVRYLSAYYETVFKDKAEDEYCLLIPYIKGNDFANGQFIEVVSRTVPMITYRNCHFWEYAVKKYRERFDLTSYNEFNGILVDAYNQFDERIINRTFCDKKFPLIAYTPEERKMAEYKLRQMGVFGDFVCIFARDNHYLQHQYGQAYGINEIRNMDINSFKSAVDYLEGQGVKAVRMGKVVNGPVNLPNCIDYAADFHSDFMDLYLCGNCKFYAGSLSGIVALAQLQSAPVVLLGVVQLGIHNSIPYRSRDIYVPKKIYDRNKKRFLNFTEMWDAEMAAKDKISKYYEEHGLEFIELGKEEIKEAIVEMNDKLDGVYQEDEQEEELQKKYHLLLENWILENGYQYSYFLHIDISGSFIKKNTFMLT